MLVERIQGRVADQMVDKRVPPVMEVIVAVVQDEEKLVPQKRVQQPTVEHAPVPHIPEETVEMMRLVQRTAEQMQCGSRCGRDRRVVEVGPT